MHNHIEVVDKETLATGRSSTGTLPKQSTHRTLLLCHWQKRRNPPGLFFGTFDAVGLTLRRCPVPPTLLTVLFANRGILADRENPSSLSLPVRSWIFEAP